LLSLCALSSSLFDNKDFFFSVTFKDKTLIPF